MTEINMCVTSNSNIEKFRWFSSNGKMNFYLWNYKKKTQCGKYLKTFPVPINPYLMVITFKYEHQKEVTINVSSNINKKQTWACRYNV